MAPPGRTKRQHRKASVSQSKAQTSAVKSQVGHQGADLTTEVQQAILNVFSIACPIVSDQASLSSTIQEVKGYLFRREFADAFGKPSYLQAYALRWSAARALCYASLLLRRDRLSWLSNARPTLPNPKTQTSQTATSSITSNDAPPARIACIGGGAGAEIVALASTIPHLLQQQSAPAPNTPLSPADDLDALPTPPIPLLHITALDSADWAQTINDLTLALTTSPPQAAHASAAAKERAHRRALIDRPGEIEVMFKQQDVLSWPDDALRECLHDTTLCTMMFTLNELFTTSLPKTTSLLLKITDVMARDSRLMVVDSPGSYSEVQLGKEGKVKQYPMKWLLDHTLLNVAGNDEDAKWEKEESEDSVWWRVDQKMLRYPVDLENMRYQIHVYRRL